MYDDEKYSFWKTFFRSFFLTLIIQIVFLIAAGISLNFTNKVVYYNDIIYAGCILAAIANITLSLKSELPMWQKLLIIILMPTNITFLVMYKGLAMKLMPLFAEFFGKLERKD